MFLDRRAAGVEGVVAEVSFGRVGLILGTEVFRLARNNADWYQLLELSTLTGTLVADSGRIYCPQAHQRPDGSRGLMGAQWPSV